MQSKVTAKMLAVECTEIMGPKPWLVTSAPITESHLTFQFLATTSLLIDHAALRSAAHLRSALHCQCITFCHLSHQTVLIDLGLPS